MCKLQASRRAFDCCDSEYEKFIRHVNPLQEYQLYCGNSDCELSDIAVQHGRDFFFEMRDMNTQGQAILSNLTACTNCGSNLSIRFLNTPPYLLIQPIYRNYLDNMFFENIPKNIKLNNCDFQLLCCTTHKQAKNSLQLDHFCAIYELDNRKFYIDDLITPEYTEHIPNIHKVTTCFYYLKKTE